MENKLELSQEVYLISGLYNEKLELDTNLYRNLIIPEDRDKFSKYIINFLSKEISNFTQEYTIIHAKDQTERVHQIKAKLLKGKPDRLIGVIQDVSEWKKIEENLLDNVTKFTLLFNQVLDGYVFHKIIYNEEDEKISYCFTDVNPAFEKITGIKKKDVIGKNISELAGSIGGKWRVAYNEVMQKNKTVQIEEYFPEIRKYLAITAYSFQKGYFVTIISDITEKIVLLHKLKESEARFRNIIESAEAGYFRIGMDGCFKNVNESWLRMHGYTFKDEVIGKHFVISQATENTEKAKENVQKILKGEAIISGVFARRCKNGEIGYHTFSANSVIDNGQITGLEGFIIDVTEQKKAEEEHTQLLEQFHQSEKMSAIGQLASGIAHDFNNQLTGIMGYSDLIRSRVKHDEKLSKYTNNMIKSLKRASDLVSKLLAFSYKGELKSVILDIHSIINEVIVLLKHSINKRIKIIKKLYDNDLASRGVASQIQNAILNIAINARDAMPDGGELTFATDIVNLDTEDLIKNAFLCEPGDYVHILISDTGSGMDKDTIKRIFEPFFTTKKRGRGTGMGLAAVYTTIKNHGGSISVNSEIECGTVFNIFLPLKISKVKEEETFFQEITKKQDSTILFIDDDDAICDIAMDALQDIGFNVILSRSGEDAVKLYKEMWNKINLVIIDVIMPGINGYETFNLLHNINPDIKALLSSGYKINKEAKKIIEKGMVGFVQKPYTFNEIKAIVMNSL